MAVAVAVMSAFTVSGQDGSIKLAENASPVEYSPMIFGHCSQLVELTYDSLSNYR